ncbi:hypothetical protein PR202_ga05534 [Eleusine coracana subsp. coracana]|uniref:Uncharacterized protein n=1 Tax=Eleusine coracana subsp. coracana TaxID=191504 RepID=A0AAV5BUW4_ELECO|nr:hypothetical protein PR202_ga05081 [Eleusine coracana subsp. coracana]GJM89348.1 hypothetical protein PR202_ga05534 [Eleusine coracana subsp. coracana]
MGGRPLSAREEELLGLLAGFPDDRESGSGRELSSSEFLVEAGGARPTDHVPARREEGHRNKTSPGKPQEEAASKKQQRDQTTTTRDKRPRRQRSGGGRGSCGGSGDGVLLNFYVPGLRLTRSMTAPRPGLIRPTTTTPVAAPAKAAAASAATGKARAQQAPLGIGCWPALWSRGRDSRRTAKTCS